MMTATPSLLHPAPDCVILSLRDPHGTLVRHEGRYLRLVKPEAVENTLAILQSGVLKKFQEEGLVVFTRRISIEETPASLNRHALILEHEEVEFPSFPYEWTKEMLAEAALLTLNLTRRFLQENRGLKDATPYNILFRGTDPVFVDFLSVEERRKTDPIWLPNAQFIRTFLIPLLLHQTLRIPLSALFLSYRDGISPIEAYRFIGFFRRLTPRFFFLVTLPNWLSRTKRARTAAFYRKEMNFRPEQAHLSLKLLFRRLEKNLSKLSRTKLLRSEWRSYEDISCPYHSEQNKKKQSAISGFFESHRSKRVLDIGCNRGTYSFMAAKSGASVVAIDSDAEVISEVYAKARKMRANILPLVINFSFPSPSLGWENKEMESFLSRAERNGFDTVLALAVAHHLCLSDGIPAQDLVHRLRKLTSRWLVIETVTSTDPMHQLLSRGRKCPDVDQALRTHIPEFFDVVEEITLVPKQRFLLICEKRSERRIEPEI